MITACENYWSLSLNQVVLEQNDYIPADLKLLKYFNNFVDPLDIYQYIATTNVSFYLYHNIKHYWITYFGVTKFIDLPRQIFIVWGLQNLATLVILYFNNLFKMCIIINNNFLLEKQGTIEVGVDVPHSILSTQIHFLVNNLHRLYTSYCSRLLANIGCN